VFGKYYTAHYDKLDKSQWYNSGEMGEYQKQVVISFVRFAGKEVPYYRDIFRKIGMVPEDIQSIDDLNSFPLLEKETVRTNAARLVDPFKGRAGKTVAVHTSGTTGKGLHLVVSRDAWQREYAFRYLHLSWAGISPNARMAFIAGHPVTAPNRMRPPFWIKDRYNGHVYFSSQHITSKTLPYYIKYLAGFRPELIRGYPSSVYLLALGVIEHGASIRPRAVFTNSETLLDHQRAVMEEAFQCKVYNWYGNAEQVGNIVECEEGNLHVKEDHSFVEFITPDGRPAQPGEIAEMVCTGFGNYAMPLIRYRVGDMAVLSDKKCPCGRSGRIVEQIVGRVEDIVVTPDGRHVGRLDHLFKDMLNVKEAQIFQEDVNSLEIRIVKRPEFGERDMRLLMQEAGLRLGNKIKIHVRFVDRIKREPSGKLRFVISKVPTAIRSSGDKAI